MLNLFENVTFIIKENVTFYCTIHLWKGGVFLYRNKEKALKLLKQKINGESTLTLKEISRLTGYSKRQLIRLSKQIEEKDINSILLHGNTGRKPSITATESEVRYIIEFKNKYPSVSISQFMDIYHEDIIWNKNLFNDVIEHNLKKRSYSFYASLYHKNNWTIPRPRKSFSKDSIKHSLRPPSPRRGILIIIDGTPHDWFENGKKQSLHLAVDDATGESLAGWFMPTECQRGFCHLLRLILLKHGIPENLYSDKHTILKSPKDDNLTQFGRMCKELGINMIFANTPQAKGKVEKANDTVQQRLLNDIKRFNIKDVEQLNEWFNDFYIGYLNKKFAYPPKEKDTEFIPLPKDIDLSNIFCLKVERKVLNGNCVSYSNNYYVPISDDNVPVPLYKSSTVQVWIDVFDTTKVRIAYKNNIYLTRCIPRKKPNNEVVSHKKINNQKEMQEILDLTSKRRQQLKEEQ